jgi:hypothetical protein
MSTLLTANLTTKIANLGSGPWTPPTFSFGEDMTLALRFAETIEGKTIEPTLDIRAMKAVMGNEDARPVSGTWKLQIGSGVSTADNTTEALQHDCTAKDLKDAIAALTTVMATHGAPAVRKVDGSWIIVFGTGLAVVPLTVRHNQLFPTCLLHGSALFLDAQYHHELRFKQVPVAINDTLDIVLPPAPFMADPPPVVGGSSGGFTWNTMQKLTVPLAFRASYELHYGYGRTARLTTADGAEQIQAALEAVAGAGNVLVTDGGPGEALIEFTGDLKGTAVDNLVVVALDPPPGDMTFTLALDAEPLHSWLRSQRAVTLPLEVWITTADDDEVLTDQLAFRVDVTVQRSVDFDELATVPVTDWLTPPSQKDYVPRSTGTVFTGTKAQAFVRGNGSATVFALAHSLATEDIRAFGRINTSGGRQLIHGTDFTAVIDNAGQVTVTSLIGAPALNAWALYLEAVEPVAAFATHTHTGAEVPDHESRLDALEGAVAAIQALLPTSQIGASTGESSTAEEILIDSFEDAFPGTIARTSTGAVDLAKLPRANGLLPACHDAALGTITTDLASLTPGPGDVFTNDTGSPLLLPGGLGVRGATVEVGEFVAWDGRRFFPASRGSSTSTSYFARDYERTLWRLNLTGGRLRAGRTAAVNFLFTARLFHTNTAMQALVVIEHGVARVEGAPLASAINLVTNNGTGTHSLIRDGVTLGTFTSVFGTDVITITGTVPVNGDVVTVTNVGGALPPPLLAATNYVVRDVSGSTFKLAAFTNTTNLLKVQWNPVPLLTRKIIIDEQMMPHRFGVRLVRAANGVITADQLYDGVAYAADSVPPLADVSLRARVIDFDPENVTIAGAFATKGTVYFKSTNAILKLT